MSENNTPETDNNDTENKGQRWVEENLRLIISVIIVVAIAAGIYSYSQRSQQTQVAFDDDTQEQVLVDETTSDDGTTTEESVTVTTTEENTDQKDSTGEAMTGEESQGETAQQSGQQEESQAQPSVASAETSKETSDAIVVKATVGNGLTNLARQALADYLTKNPDSQLTAAHKIYIEDYLRKAVGYQGHVYPGTEVSFSKSLIERAIGSSKNLTQPQLDNLQKYVARVPSLS